MYKTLILEINDTKYVFTKPSSGKSIILGLFV